jgi:plastocyanin
MPARARSKAGRAGLRAAALGLALLASAIALAACSSSPATHATSESTGTGAPAVVTIENFAFDPGTLRVSPGETVTVVNKDGVTHTLTSLSGAFNTGDIAAGTTSHFVAPAKAGSYPYRCNIHQFMTGTLIVT